MTESSNDRRPRVMVGVDGSAPARVALEFAVEEARLRDAVLVPVMAVQLPDYVWIDPYGVRGPEDTTLQQARDKLDRMLASLERTASWSIRSSRRNPRHGHWSTGRPTATYWWSDPVAAAGSAASCSAP